MPAQGRDNEKPATNRVRRAEVAAGRREFWCYSLEAERCQVPGCWL